MARPPDYPDRGESLSRQELNELKRNLSLDSWHTRGFYERAAALYHHARGTPRKRLFWVRMGRERWRIDWQKTARGK